MVGYFGAGILLHQQELDLGWGVVVVQTGVYSSHGSHQQLLRGHFPSPRDYRAKQTDTFPEPRRG